MSKEHLEKISNGSCEPRSTDRIDRYTRFVHLLVSQSCLFASIFLCLCGRSRGGQRGGQWGGVWAPSPRSVPPLFNPYGSASVLSVKSLLSHVAPKPSIYQVPIVLKSCLRISFKKLLNRTCTSPPWVHDKAEMLFAFDKSPRTRTAYLYLVYSKQ